MARVLFLYARRSRLWARRGGIVTISQCLCTRKHEPLFAVWVYKRSARARTSHPCLSNIQQRHQFHFPNTSMPPSNAIPSSSVMFLEVAAAYGTCRAFFLPFADANFVERVAFSRRQRNSTKELGKVIPQASVNPCGIGSKQMLHSSSCPPPASPPLLSDRGALFANAFILAALDTRPLAVFFGELGPAADAPLWLRGLR